MNLFAQFYRVPKNLRPQVYNLHVPQEWLPNNRTVWRYLNRTLYRSAEDCTDAQRFWLRNEPSLSDSGKLMLEKYDHIAYPDDLFYKVHKISIKDFIEKLESA